MIEMHVHESQYISSAKAKKKVSCFQCSSVLAGFQINFCITIIIYFCYDFIDVFFEMSQKCCWNLRTAGNDLIPSVCVSLAKGNMLAVSKIKPLKRCCCTVHWMRQTASYWPTKKKKKSLTVTYNKSTLITSQLGSVWGYVSTVVILPHQNLWLWAAAACMIQLVN